MSSTNRIVAIAISPDVIAFPVTPRTCCGHGFVVSSPRRRAGCCNVGEPDDGKRI